MRISFPCWKITLIIIFFQANAHTQTMFEIHSQPYHTPHFINSNSGFVQPLQMLITTLSELYL